MVGLAAQPAQERAHQELRVEPIRLGAPVIPLDRDARGMNDIGLDIVLAEQSREPEAVAPRLEGDADPPHHASGPPRLLAPALDQFEQPFRVRRQLLQRIARQARRTRGDEPTRLAQFNDDDQRAIWV
jgi:hypothetical protein